MSEHIEYKEGNVRELWTTSIPLMLSWLSAVGMTFVDRLYLAHYSLEALNSTVTAGTMAWAFTYSIHVLCEMSQVFVAQYNGAKQYQKLGKPVWQMIWVALASFLILAPIGYFGKTAFFPPGHMSPMHGEYFSILLYFGFSFGIFGALSAFYIGQGRTSIVTLVMVVGNIFNVILDPILIFGIPGVVPSLGVQGAAIATGLGAVVQGAILFALFVQKKNQEEYGTNCWKFNPREAYECLKVGFPIALLLALEIAGWGIFYAMMSYASPVHILVTGVCQSIVILFFFFGIGLEKGVAAIAGNLIGAKRHNRVNKLLWSSFYLVLGFFLISAIPLVIYPQAIIQLFLKDTASVNLNPQDLMYVIKIGLGISVFYLFFENIRMAANGILTAAGDTFFLMFSGVISIWLFLLVPTYFWVIRQGASTEQALLIWIFYALITAGISFYRYLSGQWQKKRVIDPAY